MSPQSQEGRNSKEHKTFSQGQIDVKEKSRENPGLLAVRLCDRYPTEGQTEGHKSSMVLQGKREISRQKSSTSTKCEEETSPMDKGQKSGKVSSLTIPVPKTRHSHRRLLNRLGGILPVQESPRTMVDSIPPTPYQCLGGHGGIPNSKTTDPSQDPTYKIGPRQRSHSPLHKQRRLQTFEDNSAGVGVVTGPKIIQMDLISGPGSPGRPVCNRVQPQTRVLRSPQPGPSGLCHRRNVVRLEHLGENLLIPTNKPVDESARQIQNFQRPGCSSSPQLAQEQLASPAGGTGSPPSTDTQSNTNTSSTNSQCIRFLKNSECPNF
ncbi:uncharacterized protein, partial [Palaemon carinicauda]|uniref:uncharacterized protein n=1 Tax=Palaemon carinicauda TaxID=392227 RepID=UPI0035B60FBC